MSTRWRIEKPGSDEHAPYYQGYIDEAPQTDIVLTLEKQGGDLGGFFRAIPEAKGAHRYAPEKWSVKDVILHVCDAERVFAYRLLRFARNDATNLPGFDENLFVKFANADGQAVAQLAEQFVALRKATVALVAPMDDEAMNRRGTANNNPISARAIAWILAGHAGHHARILRERYL